MEEQLRAVRLEMEKEQERENCERDSVRMRMNLLNLF